MYRGQRLELVDSNSPRHLVVHFIMAVYCENTAAQTASFDLSTILSNTQKNQFVDPCFQLFSGLKFPDAKDTNKKMI